jgi:hypothetical protein
MKTKQHQLIQAKIIRRNFGFSRALKYMVSRGWTIEGTLWTLLKTTVREKK